VNDPDRPSLATGGGGLRVRVPMTFKRRGGRKEIVVSEGLDAAASPAPRSGDPLVLAIARAHRWKELLEIGRYAEITELARAMGVNSSYVGRLLNLTLLAPDIVETIVSGRDPGGLSLERLYRLPLAWEEQRRTLAADRKGER